MLAHCWQQVNRLARIAPRFDPRLECSKLSLCTISLSSSPVSLPVEPARLTDERLDGASKRLCCSVGNTIQGSAQFPNGGLEDLIVLLWSGHEALLSTQLELWNLGLRWGTTQSPSVYRPHRTERP